MLPAAGIVDGAAAPHTCSSVEVEKDTAASPAGMLEHEMPIQQDGFNLSEKRVVAVDVRPASLHHADIGIGEVVNDAQYKIFRGNEIRVKNGDELALSRLKTFRQRACLESLAVGTMMVGDRESPGGIMIDQPACHRNGFIRRVVEHLNVKLFQGIAQAANGVQQPLGHELLIEDGKLDRDSRELREKSAGLGGALLLVLVIEINQDVAMGAIGCQQDQHDEIGNEQGCVKSIGVI